MSWEAAAVVKAGEGGGGDGGDSEGGEKWMDSGAILQQRSAELLTTDVGFEVQREAKETVRYLVRVIG